jgi:hypothetical protein
LFESLIQTFTQPAEIVLDPAMGTKNDATFLRIAAEVFGLSTRQSA